MQLLTQGHETQYSSTWVSAIISKLQSHHLSLCLLGGTIRGAAKESWRIFHTEVCSLPHSPFQHPNHGLMIRAGSYSELSQRAERASPVLLKDLSFNLSSHTDGDPRMLFCFTHLLERSPTMTFKRKIVITFFEPRTPRCNALNTRLQYNAFFLIMGKESMKWVNSDKALYNFIYSEYNRAWA